MPFIACLHNTNSSAKCFTSLTLLSPYKMPMKYVLLTPYSRWETKALRDSLTFQSCLKQPSWKRNPGLPDCKTVMPLEMVGWGKLGCKCWRRTVEKMKWPPGCGCASYVLCCMTSVNWHQMKSRIPNVINFESVSSLNSPGCFFTTKRKQLGNGFYGVVGITKSSILIRLVTLFNVIQ